MKNVGGAFPGPVDVRFSASETGGTWKADFSGTGTKAKSSGTAYVR